MGTLGGGVTPLLDPPPTGVGTLSVPLGGRSLLLIGFMGHPPCRGSTPSGAWRYPPPWAGGTRDPPIENREKGHPWAGVTRPVGPPPWGGVGTLADPPPGRGWGPMENREKGVEGAYDRRRGHSGRDSWTGRTLGASVRGYLTGPPNLAL